MNSKSSQNRDGFFEIRYFNGKAIMNRRLHE